MNTLKIEDLSATEELGAKEMAAVRGGHGFAPYYSAWLDGSDHSVKNLSIGEQFIGQSQAFETAVGNNVAVLGGFADPTVSVTGDQKAKIVNNVSM